MSCGMLLLALASLTPVQQPAAMKIAAPELRDITEWLNTKPLELKAQQGKVVVLHFWAFGCINCIRNLPHYQEWHKRFADKEVLFVGVHTPETKDESNLERVRQMVKDNDMRYPIAVDNGWKTWEAWGNRYWPAVYLIDKKGFVRYRWDGELNWQGSKGEAVMRQKIEELLAEQP